ncbi:hypothetical protein FOA52_003304 [Chlamydomonas sp. UWO 241]|nr:hypothetical protein FOA52_003304 [Chlamydomonas sp. UWO 241]
MPFFIKSTNHGFMATALGFSAGIMLYVSFVEIFTSKSIQGFERAGFPANKAYQYATLSFFAGMLITWLLDLICHGLIHLQDYLQARKEMREGSVEASKVEGSALSRVTKNSDTDLEMAAACAQSAAAAAETGTEV